MPDVLGEDKARVAGQRAMLVTTGMSAATTARLIADLAKETPGTALVLVTRGQGFHLREGG